MLQGLLMVLLLSSPVPLLLGHWSRDGQQPWLKRLRSNVFWVTGGMDPLVVLLDIFGQVERHLHLSCIGPILLLSNALHLSPDSGSRPQLPLPLAL